ncbi:MAG TPA: NUDIX domain-containing protein [Symbiobacteriaceae bacterium]
MHETWQGLRAVARVLIQNSAGELLLCRSRSGRAWVPPGGTLDPGESLPEAAVREAAEEAGLPVEVGPLVYLQEFRPAGGREHVIEVAFAARALAEHPEPAPRVQPAGPADRPWRAWYIQDVDGPRREVRWFTREELRALPEPVYPAFLTGPYWECRDDRHDRYLGLVRAE